MQCKLVNVYGKIGFFDTQTPGTFLYREIPLCEAKYKNLCLIRHNTRIIKRCPSGSPCATFPAAPKGRGNPDTAIPCPSLSGLPTRIPEGPW